MMKQDIRTYEDLKEHKLDVQTKDNRKADQENARAITGDTGKFSVTSTRFFEPYPCLFTLLARLYCGVIIPQSMFLTSGNNSIFVNITCFIPLRDTTTVKLIIKIHEKLSLSYATAAKPYPYTYLCFLLQSFEFLQQCRLMGFLNMSSKI